MGVLLQQVKAETLTNNRLTGPTGMSRGLLEGEHRSMFHGRSLEFDDLRPYILGTMSATSTGGRLPDLPRCW
ncbi:Uncharacterised protein [Mycobacteroides abscessus]|nr:Uncharacterised protein [Mycobacteroides abscessus]